MGFRSVICKEVLQLQNFVSLVYAGIELDILYQFVYDIALFCSALVQQLLR